jgi:hypothetical protein
VLPPETPFAAQSPRSISPQCDARAAQLLRKRNVRAGPQVGEEGNGSAIDQMPQSLFLSLVGRAVARRQPTFLGGNAQVAVVISSLPPSFSPP